MDKDVNIDLLDDNPPKKIFFTVEVSFNYSHPLLSSLEKNYGLLTAPIKSFPVAISIMDKFALSVIDISKEEIKKVDIYDSPDAHRIYLVDDKNLPMVSIGAILHDLRNEVFN